VKRPRALTDDERTRMVRQISLVLRRHYGEQGDRGTPSYKFLISPAVVAREVVDVFELMLGPEREPAP
jgi:hypothetical protein